MFCELKLKKAAGSGDLKAAARLLSQHGSQHCGGEVSHKNSEGGYLQLHTLQIIPELRNEGVPYGRRQGF